MDDLLLSSHREQAQCARAQQYQCPGLWHRCRAGGEIPQAVSRVQLYVQVEPHVPQITAAFRKKLMYPHWKAAGGRHKSHLRHYGVPGLC